MALATVDPRACRRWRMVLMKGYDTAGFVFLSHMRAKRPVTRRKS